MKNISFKTPLLLIALSAMTLSFPSIGAAEEPGISFYPSQSWKVAENSAKSACVISSEFNNGFVIAFNGSDKWVQSLAIDFRQNIFNPDQSYNVSLAVPGKFQQSYKAKAISQTALQVDLRTSSDFYKGAIQTSVFDFSLEQNSFRFFLTRIASTKDQFEQCMASMKQGMKMAAKTTPDNMKAEEFRHNEAQAWEENKGQSTLSATDKSARPAESSMPPLPEKSVEPVPSKVSTPAPSTRSEKSGYMAEMARKANEEMGMTPEPGKAASPTAKTTTTMQTEEYKVKKKKMSATMDLTKTPEASIRKDSMASEAISQSNNAEMARKISKLEATIEKMKVDNDILEDELKSALAESEQERLSISSDNWNLERATMRFNEAERQIVRLGQQLQREKAQCTMEKQELEAMLFDPQVTNQAQLAKLADLENQLANAEEQLESQRARYEERIRLLESQLQTN